MNVCAIIQETRLLSCHRQEGQSWFLSQWQPKLLQPALITLTLVHTICWKMACSSKKWFSHCHNIIPACLKSPFTLLFPCIGPLNRPFKKRQTFLVYLEILTNWDRSVSFLLCLYLCSIDHHSKSIGPMLAKCTDKGRKVEVPTRTVTCRQRPYVTWHYLSRYAI